MGFELTLTKTFEIPLVSSGPASDAHCHILIEGSLKTTKKEVPHYVRLCLYKDIKLETNLIAFHVQILCIKPLCYL